MNYKKIILSFFVCLIAIQPVSAYVCTASVWRLETDKGPIRVLLQGDNHAESPIIDKSHRKSFFDLLQRLRHREREIDFLIEAPRDIRWFDRSPFADQDSLIKALHEDDQYGFLHAYVCLAAYDQPFGSVHLVRGDRRGFKSITLSSNLQKILALSADRLDEEKTSLSNNLNSTVAELYQGLKPTEELAQKFLESDECEAFKASMRKCQKKFAESISAAKEFFSKYSPHENAYVTDAFFNYAKENPMLNSAQINVFMERAGFLGITANLADIGFIDHFAKLIKTGNDVIFLAGALHTEVIEDLLRTYGAKCLGEARVLDRGPVLNEMLKELFNIFENNCFMCHKSVEAMKTCGGCKIAKYCSAECQKKDWPSHKSNCKK